MIYKALNSSSKTALNFKITLRTDHYHYFLVSQVLLLEGVQEMLTSNLLLSSVEGSDDNSDENIEEEAGTHKHEAH